MNINMNLQELEQMAECCPFGVIIVGNDMTARLWNDAALALIGVDTGDLLSGTIETILDKKVVSMITTARQMGAASTQQFQYDSKKRNVKYTIRVLPGDGGAENILMIVEDSTKLIEIESVKHDFINMLLFKLRGPLSTLKTSFAVLQNNTRDKFTDDVKEIIDIGYHEVNRLAILVGDLRDLFHIETGLAARELVIEEFPVSKAMDNAIAEIVTMPLPFKSIRERLKCNGASDSKIKADFEKTKKVFGILLKNALMYSKETTIVTVEFRGEKGYVDITIKDCGIGLDKKNMPFLFTKYFRENNNMTKNSEGNGLGLFIAKSLIELMKGTIYGESAQGKGSVFSISLPAADG